MVRDMETFYPRKDEMGNGPIELVLGNVLDKVGERHSSVARKASCCVVLCCVAVASSHEQDNQRRGSAAQGGLGKPVRTSSS